MRRSSGNRKRAQRKPLSFIIHEMRVKYKWRRENKVLAFFRKIGYNKDGSGEKRKTACEPEAVAIVLNDRRRRVP